jgi:hypothetical protein
MIVGFCNYLCNQCQSPLKLWVRTLFMTRCTLYNIVWLATGQRLKHGNCLLFSFFLCLFLRYIMVFHCILSVGWFMVFNATFNNISVISWRSVLLVEETGVPGENHRPVASHWQTLSHNAYWKNLITDCQQLFMFCLTHKKLISCSFQFLFFFSCIFVSTAIKVVMHLCVYVY